MLVLLLNVAKHLGDKERVARDSNYKATNNMFESTLSLQSTIVMLIDLPPSFWQRQNSITTITRF